MVVGKRVCAGYEDGSVRIWDLKTGAVIHTLSGIQGFCADSG